MHCSIFYDIYGRGCLDLVLFSIILVSSPTSLLPFVICDAIPSCFVFFIIVCVKNSVKEFIAKIFTSGSYSLHRFSIESPDVPNM